MIPWEHIAEALAPDGAKLELRKRADEFLIMAGGRDLMSSRDDGSSRALAELGCAHIHRDQPAQVLIGGLGMGFTLRAALDRTGPRATVVVAELVDAVAQWNREHLGSLAEHPLDDPRTELRLEDVRTSIAAGPSHYDAILLDVDNGPSALAHRGNQALYDRRGIARAREALRPGGVLGVWSFTDDSSFTRRLRKQRLATKVHRVEGSRKGRGRYHWVWVARRP